MRGIATQIKARGGASNLASFSWIKEAHPN